jgi:SEC-C motif-containing protein
MRARYSAFASGNVEFISSTIAPDKRSDYDEESIRKWSTSSEWLGFEIKRIDGGKERDTTGIVEFIAHYKTDNQNQDHHEIAQFKKIDGLWYFVDGTLVNQMPFVREEPRIGRNDPCSCGSGKKFKKCCMSKEQAKTEENVETETTA